MKRPSFQFYPADWLRDTSLRTCSVGARGLWIDMICYMHEGTPYGHLKVKDKVILTENLARMVGETFENVKGWLDELYEAGVYQLAEDGSIYSKRMVKDEALRNARAEGGKLGGNPALLAMKDNLKVNQEVKQNTTPSSSSSSTSSITPIPPRGAYVSQEIKSLFEKFWQYYPKKVGKDAALKAFAKRKPDEKLLLQMLKALAIQKGQPNWIKEDGQYIPNPATWLNQGRWEDQVGQQDRSSIFAGGI
jgi:hypothetical protein